jgi:hypothetical protein
MNRFIVFSFLFISFNLYAQSDAGGFPYGKVTYRELEMEKYDRDTSASAVILNEFGEAHIDSENDHNLIFTYHSKIKILKTQALEIADFEIPLHKYEAEAEKLLSVKASSFNFENGTMKETKLETKNVFTHDEGKYGAIKKFAVPNVRVGSVIEIQYVLESPFVFNFRSWQFQSEWPKVYSEYWARIPGNYLYNMSLKGFLQLLKNESEVVKDCFSTGGGRSDCAFFRFAMKDIPAFIKEDYMTAPSNFISAINFELSEIKDFDGRSKKFTEEWKDAELRLKREENFGLQLRRGKDIGEQIELLTASITDPLAKAKKVYDFIKGWYRWNGEYGKYSDLGIKKAFDQKTGNVGDINLSLIAALRFAGLSVEPVILSTRENGLPIEIHPVLSDFNYLIAKVTIAEQSYLLDATEDLYPFGLIPERCLNGKGRALGEDESYWIELKPTNKRRQMSMLNIKLGDDGILTGNLQTTFVGYEAVRVRKKIYSYSTTQEYIDAVKNTFEGIEVKSVELSNVDDIEKPVLQKMELSIPAFESNSTTFLFNPFITNRWEENPFRSNERLHPVDFGVPIDEVMLVTIQYPQTFEIVNLPEKTGLALPNSGGRYIVDGQNVNGTVTISSSLLINRPIFSSQEYHYLKELFNRIVQVQNTDLLFKRK